MPSPDPSLCILSKAPRLSEIPVGKDLVRAGRDPEAGDKCTRVRAWIGALAEADLEPLVKGALSSCWELRREETCALGVTSVLGGRAEMVRLYPSLARPVTTFLVPPTKGPCPGI